MNQSREREAQKRRLRIPDLRRPVVHIADLSGRIQNKNHVLRMVQDTLVEIALVPQRRPGNLLVGNVENQSTILHRRSFRFANRRDVEERLQWASVFSSQRGLMVA